MKDQRAPAKNFRPLFRNCVLSLTVATLAACSTTYENRYTSGDTNYIPLPIADSASRLSKDIPRQKLTTASRQLAAEGINALDKQDYIKASSLFNLALKTDINNSYLHFFNALTYHLRALNGEGALYELAQQGYEMAVQFDSSNVIARQYLGQLYLDRRDYASARVQLMEAALYNRNDPDMLYSLSLAAYYAKDVRTASAALQGLRNIEADKREPRTLRASAIVSAAEGNLTAAQQYLNELRLAGDNRQYVSYTEQRVQSWKDTSYNGMSDIVLAQADSEQQEQQYTQTQMDRQQDSESAFYEQQMVMLDVSIIATEEDNTDTSGINLLSGLQIQFGDSVGTAGYSRQISKYKDTVDPTNNTSNRTVTRLIQIPALTYTLNIANSLDMHSEILARPSLVALGGQTSSFFSGTDVIGAAVSTGQGGSVQVQKEAGVKLAVTPQFLPGDLILIKVQAERTFLTNPSSSVKFEYRLDTSKTIVDATVAMKFGETLILSGLSERETDVHNNGVPFLRDIPIVQYLFSQKSKREYMKSVMILITPRRPHYTNRSQEDIETERRKMSKFERTQLEFEEKYKDWFQTAPNVSHTMRSLESSSFYREFRTGDLEVNNWTSRTSHGERMKSALNFLYY